MRTGVRWVSAPVFCRQRNGNNKLTRVPEKANTIFREALSRPPDFSETTLPSARPQLVHTHTECRAPYYTVSFFFFFYYSNPSSTLSMMMRPSRPSPVSNDSLPFHKPQKFLGSIKLPRLFVRHWLANFPFVLEKNRALKNDPGTPARRSTVEAHLNFSAFPHLRSSILSHPTNDLSKNQIASRWKNP